MVKLIGQVVVVKKGDTWVDSVVSDARAKFHALFPSDTSVPTAVYAFPRGGGENGVTVSLAGHQTASMYEETRGHHDISIPVSMVTMDEIKGISTHWYSLNHPAAAPLIGSQLHGIRFELPYVDGVEDDHPIHNINPKALADYRASDSMHSHAEEHQILHGEDVHDRIAVPLYDGAKGFTPEGEIYFPILYRSKWPKVRQELADRFKSGTYYGIFPSRDHMRQMDAYHRLALSSPYNPRLGLRARNVGPATTMIILVRFDDSKDKHRIAPGADAFNRVFESGDVALPNVARLVPDSYGMSVSLEDHATVDLDRRALDFNPVPIAPVAQKEQVAEERPHITRVPSPEPDVSDPIHVDEKHVIENIEDLKLTAESQTTQGGLGAWGQDSDSDSDSD